MWFMAQVVLYRSLSRWQDAVLTTGWLDQALDVEQFSVHVHGWTL